VSTPGLATAFTRMPRASAGSRLGEGVDGALGGRAVRQLATAFQIRHRPGVDDRTAASQVRNGGARHEEVAGDVDTQ